MITVVIPVYNTDSKYLKESIESVLNQTYKDFELIIVNDGSNNEETLTCLSEYRNREGISVIDQPNKKISGALNTGIKAMKGEWWAGLSSDDRWLPNKLQAQVDYATYHPEAKVIYADWDMIDENGNIVQTIIEPAFIDHKEAKKRMAVCYFATWSNLLVHKSVFEKIGLFNETYPTCEDYEFNVRMIEHYMFYKVPRILMNYRIHNKQLSKTEWGYGGKFGSYYQSKAKAFAIERLG